MPCAFAASFKRLFANLIDLIRRNPQNTQSYYGVPRGLMYRDARILVASSRAIFDSGRIVQRR